MIGISCPRGATAPDDRIDAWEICVPAKQSLNRVRDAALLEIDHRPGVNSIGGLAGICPRGFIVERHLGIGIDQLTGQLPLRPRDIVSEGL